MAEVHAVAEARSVSVSSLLRDGLALVLLADVAGGGAVVSDCETTERTEAG
jgi:hypothetical protein